MTDVDINLSEYTKREEFDGKVGLSSIEEIKSEVSPDLTPYAEKSKIGLKYDSDEKKIYIGTEGISGYGASIDASDFIKDGMISSVSYDKDTHKLTITWNTSAGHDETVIDLSGLVDVYTAGNGLTSEVKEDGTEFKIDDSKVVTKTAYDWTLSGTTLGEMFGAMATQLGGTLT